MKKIESEFITMNEILKNISILWSDMTEEEKEKCVESFLWEIIRFIEKYTLVKH